MERQGIEPQSRVLWHAQMGVARHRWHYTQHSTMVPFSTDALGRSAADCAFMRQGTPWRSYPSDMSLARGCPPSANACSNGRLCTFMQDDQEFMTAAVCAHMSTYRHKSTYIHHTVMNRTNTCTRARACTLEQAYSRHLAATSQRGVDDRPSHISVTQRCMDELGIVDQHELGVRRLRREV